MLVRPPPSGALKAPLAAWVLPLALALGCSPAKIDFSDTGPVGQDDTDTDDTDTGPDTVTDGALAVTPATLDYGVVFVGQTGVLEVAVQNVGDGDIALSVTLADAAAPFGFTVPANPAPGETVTIAVTFAPTEFGAVAGSLVIADTLGEGEVTVALAGAAQIDADTDGVGSIESGGTDCDDANPAAYPGADEIWYDGVDQDCDGADDYDRDADGSVYTDDCDDGNAAVHPGAAETWYDGTDADCAGDDDFDQDADGFAVGADCDDVDAAVNPAADEVWYDGTDQDCDGVDDDQDLDGYGFADDCNDLDAAVNPGAAEVWYDGVDGDCAGDDDYDQDADGVTVGTDCVDTDPTVTGPVTETLDGLDSDCDGVIDDVAIGDAASGWLYGGVASLGIGDSDGLSLGGDLTGDGTDDLVVSTDSYSSGYAFVVSGPVAAAAAGNIDSYDTAVVTGPSTYYPLGNVVGPATDVTGDGNADLLVAGSNTSYGYGYGWVLSGGSGLTGSLSTSTTYAARFEGDSSGDSTFWVAAGDIDGDGVGDVVQAAVTDNYSTGYYGGDTAAGNVSVHSGTVSGTYDITDADDEIHGSNDYDYFGTGLVVSDVDGDGYADILAGAGYNDDGGSSAGAIYLLLGNASLA
ncbi:MAG: MopE-related protein, partial [Myxococcota bacterium]